MAERTYDFLVLGGGSAGYAAARTAVSEGLRTAVVDGADELGGLCILRGCMPSKALIASANRARAARGGKEFGVHTGEVSLDPKRVVERKRALIGDFASYRQAQLEDGRFDLLRGRARFIDTQSVEIDFADGHAEVVGFGSACVATGSVIRKIPVPGLEEAGYWISDDILEQEHLPRSVIVLGGGAIALEMACYLEGAGVEVTVIQRSPHILTGSDHDVADALQAAMESRPNLTVITGTTLRSVAIGESGKKIVTFLHGDTEKSVEADQILQALGRRPNSEPVEPSNAGIETASSGHMLCNPFQQTAQPNIFVAGDVCGPHEVVHIAIEQGEIAARNAARLLRGRGEPLEAIDYRLKLFGVFTDPQVATVGLTELEAKDQGIPIVSASSPFDDHGKSMIEHELHGFVKLLADSRTGELVGGAVVGPEAVELIHEIVVAINYKATATEFLKIPHYHPTLSEIWTYPAEELIFPVE